MTWLKNGSPLRMEAARVSLTPGGALELDPLRAHDAATYRCSVALAHAHGKPRYTDILYPGVTSLLWPNGGVQVTDASISYVCHPQAGTRRASVLLYVTPTPSRTLGPKRDRTSD